MYTSIYVPVDNSDHSNRAVACALGLGKAYSAKLVGCHVYAAKLHDYRFRQMEYTLPEEYIDEVELERQRKRLRPSERTYPKQYIAMVEGTIRRLEMELEQKRRAIEDHRRVDVVWELLAAGIVRVTAPSTADAATQ
jgi:nucleotide-binding universal stress UspA family protein